MGQISRINDKKTETKRKNTGFKVQKSDLSRSVNSPTNQIMFLQRTIGNQAVEGLFNSRIIQAKLTIDEQRDIHEQEASKVTDQLMRISEADIRPKPTCKGGGSSRGEEEDIQTKTLTAEHPTLLRQVDEEKEGRIQPSLQPETIQRWNLGTAPAPAGWDVIADPEHLRRYNQAEAIVRRVLTSRRCLGFFRANCTSGAANPLQEAFDRANVYIRLVDDAATGAQIGDNISFNLRAFRIGRWRIANALLHETFHACDPVFDARDEIDAETAVEQCRVFTPFISNRRPRSGPVGTRVTIEGIGFGPSQGPADQVLFNGVDAGRAVSWGLVGTPGSSMARIVCVVPAGATTGDLVVVNNTVHSNAFRFEVTP